VQGQLAICIMRDVSSSGYQGIVVISAPMTIQELQALGEQRFGDMVKGVVDTKRRVLALGGSLHADEEKVLLQQGSEQADLWGINIYPAEPRPGWVEFDSLINLKPRLGNRSRSIDDASTRQLIIEIVDSLIR
jgi:hypothetical protein